MKLINFLILFAIFSVNAPFLFSAVQIHPKAGTTSASFLKIGVGSRAIAMGSSYAGLADDVTALYWNPAGLMNIKKNEVGFTHNESFEEIRHDFGGYVYPSKNYAVGCALYGLYMPEDIERRSGLNESDPFEPLSSIESYFKAYDFAAQFSYARNFQIFKQVFAFGASLKYIYQNIDVYNANAFALDLGSLYQFKKIPMSAGLVLQNIGTPIKFIEKSYQLPFNVKLGAAYKWRKKITAVLDFNQPIDNYLFISGGAEYIPFSMIALRAGYRYRLNGLELGDLSGLSTGMGFNFNLKEIAFKLDYAYVPYGVLGYSHRFTLGLLFGKTMERTEDKPVKKDESNAAAVEVLKSPDSDVESVKPEDTYIYYPAVLSGKLKMASGRFAVYSIKAKFSGSDIVSLTGETTISVSNQLIFEAGEKTGGNKVYKYFSFRKNFLLPVQKVYLKIKLPEYMNPSLKTDDDTEISLIQESEDENFKYYKAYLPALVPFRIENR